MRRINPRAAALVGLVAICALCSRCSALDGEFQLSKNFHQKEFNQKRQPLSLFDYKMDPLLIEKLEALRSAIGNKPITITSGYRSSEYNESVGGAARSQHIKGKAADIQVSGMTPGELNEYAKEVGFSFTLVYKYHLHVDVR